jgi:hypothetical protein
MAFAVAQHPSTGAAVGRVDRTVAAVGTAGVPERIVQAPDVLAVPGLTFTPRVTTNRLTVAPLTLSVTVL